MEDSHPRKIVKTLINVLGLRKHSMPMLMSANTFSRSS